MATDPSLVFDLGPLSWVQGEIDQALQRGLETIALFKANPADATALKHARAHVHQAAGAITFAIAGPRAASSILGTLGICTKLK